MDDINHRMYGRLVPDAHLRPNFDFRSTPTRSVHVFPVMDPRKVPRVPIRNTIQNGSALGSGTSGPSKGPVQGFRVNAESELRNQYFALQHGAPQGVYIPRSESDLYQVSLPENSTPVPLPHQYLQPKDQYSTTGMQQKHIGTQLFHNATQLQMRTSIE